MLLTVNIPVLYFACKQHGLLDHVYLNVLDAWSATHVSRVHDHLLYSRPSQHTQCDLTAKLLRSEGSRKGATHLSV